MVDHVITEDELPVKTKTLFNEHAREEHVGPLKKSYQKPALKTYGPVKQLTRGQGGSRADGNSGRARQ